MDTDTLIGTSFAEGDQVTDAFKVMDTGKITVADQVTKRENESLQSAKQSVVLRQPHLCQRSLTRQSCPGCLFQSTNHSSFQKSRMHRQPFTAAAAAASHYA